MQSAAAGAPNKRKANAFPKKPMASRKTARLLRQRPCSRKTFYPMPFPKGKRRTKEVRERNPGSKTRAARNPATRARGTKKKGLKAKRLLLQPPLPRLKATPTNAPQKRLQESTPRQENAGCRKLPTRPPQT